MTTYRFTGATTIGKQTDATVYRAAFAPVWRETDAHQVEIIIHIEHIAPAEIPNARVHLFMINHEISFDDRYSNMQHIGRMHYILCKTRAGLAASHALVEQKHVQCTPVYLGFSSPFTSIACTPDWTRVLHLAGSSPYKNTATVIQTWIRHPEWPELVVICRELCRRNAEKYGVDWKAAGRAPNIRVHERVDNVVELQCTIRTHLCPSITEGYGHYINEARAAGALIITSDLAPMNELVDAESGILTRCGQILLKQHNMIPIETCVAPDIERAVQTCIEMPIAEKIRLGARARVRYLAETADFMRRARAFAEGLAGRLASI